MTRPPVYSLAWLEGLHRATVTTAEAGAVLGLTPRTVVRLINAHELEGGRAGHKYYVSVAALIRRLRQ